MKRLVVLSMVGTMCLAGCATPMTKTQTGGVYGTAGGAATGAILGQVIGGDTKGTLIGAAIGAAVGGLAGAGVGHMMDQQEQQMSQALASSDAVSVQRNGDLLAVTLKGDVSFDTNSSVVRPGIYSELDRIASSLRQYPQTVVRIEGHTDSDGAEAYNMDLSRRRAEAVGNLLMQRGVDASRMEVVAFGESSPIATNATEAGRQMNRRVVIVIAPRPN
ncbi:MAG: OmpA family protein [Desulfoarculaceae bacterium]|nr:OmpA family protein [Desulfoarculaceae bacterium]